MTTETKFPYDGWILTPSFKPVKKTFVRVYGAYANWHIPDEGGKNCHVSEIYKTKEAAVEAGFKKLNAEQAAIDKRQVNLTKRIANLKKYGGV